MLERIAHRGPDGRGVWKDDRVVLGHVRLSIIDLSDQAEQPMQAGSSNVFITYNGEIYNYKELRTDLKKQGYLFKSTSDTEVILALYLKYGYDCVHHLRGIFAFAIYDCRDGRGREKLFLARDHFGVKPLLYSQKSDCFIFASEIKAVLASGEVSKNLDSIALRELLMMGSIYQPRTILKDVKALPPAHFMIVSPKGTELKRYWALEKNRISGLKEAPYSEMVDAVSKAISESVQHQMIADVTVGAFLSGGIDSSLMAALMQKFGHGKLKTFSVGFGQEGKNLDETKDAEEIAQHLGTDHHRLEITSKDIIDSISCLGAALDQPSIDGINSFFVSKAAAQEVKVAISGTGGDEIFAGYPWFSAIHKHHSSKALMFLARKARDIHSSNRYMNKILDQIRYCDLSYKYSSIYKIFSSAQADDLLSSQYKIADTFEHADFPDRVTELSDGDALERASAFCLRGYTQNQLLRDIDVMSMSHSLEVRVPFLDPKVVNVALSLPMDAKIFPKHGLGIDPSSYRATGNKRILLDIGEKLLPDNFNNRMKRGFTFPFDHWLKHDLKELVNDVLSKDAIRQRELFDEHKVYELIQGQQKGYLPWNYSWIILMVELWCEQVLDN